MCYLMQISTWPQEGPKRHSVKESFQQQVIKFSNLKDVNHITRPVIKLPNLRDVNHMIGPVIRFPNLRDVNYMTRLVIKFLKWM